MSIVQHLTGLCAKALEQREATLRLERILQREYDAAVEAYKADPHKLYLTAGYGQPLQAQMECRPMKKVQFLFNLDRAVKMSGKYDGGRRHNRTEAVALLYDAIPLSRTDRDHLYEGNPVRIVCTPEQFTRYLINRCTAGYLNCFRELEVREAFTPTMPRIIYARESVEDVGDLPS